MCLIPWLGRRGHQTQLAKKMTVYLLTRQIFAIGNTISLSLTHIHHQKYSFLDFPGGPVVTTLHFQCRGSGLIPGRERSHISCGVPTSPWPKKRENSFSLSLSPLPLQWEPLLVFPLISCYCSLQMHPWVEPYHSVRSPPHRFISVSSFWFSPSNVSLFL